MFFLFHYFGAKIADLNVKIAQFVKMLIILKKSQMLLNLKGTTPLQIGQI